jgi:DNA (cytosine-5)-methyltransferase 1
METLFDLLPEEEAKKYRAIKSNDWKWTMANDYPEKNGLKVFSCFACGGGSTMGYKLCGCEVVGCNEIDPQMNRVYVLNHNPKYNYLMDIRDFNKILKRDLPKELYNLDILDGSPPCSTFSIAGEREDAWGKKKKFREGQKEQTLDDLLFVFIDTVKKLKPKVAILENVEGLILGDAWKYVQEIYKRFNDIGYKVKHWLLKGENMGIPQTRHRVFFIATKLDFDLTNIDLTFNYEPITYKEIKSGELKQMGKDTLFYKIAAQANKNDKSIADTRIRLGQKGSAFQTLYVRDDMVIPTQRAKPDLIDIENVAYVSKETLRNCQTFPQDYNFNPDSYSNIGYICGMSVPPIMIKRIVTRMIESGIFDYKLKN